jgi:hypothetical protein
MAGRPPAAPSTVVEVKPAKWIRGAPLQQARGRSVLQPGGSGPVLLVTIDGWPLAARNVAVNEVALAEVQLWQVSNSAIRPNPAAPWRVTAVSTVTGAGTMLGSIQAPLAGTGVAALLSSYSATWQRCAPANSAAQRACIASRPPALPS